MLNSFLKGMQTSTSSQERPEGLNCRWPWFATGHKSICESKFLPILLHFMVENETFTKYGWNNNFFISCGTVKNKIDENSKPLAFLMAVCL